MLYPAQDPAPPRPLVVRQSPPAELFFLSLFLAWHIVRFAVHRGLICSDMRSVIHSHEGHWPGAIAMARAGQGRVRT